MKIKKKRKSIILKRIIDVVVSGIGLIILFPIFVVIGALIKLDSKGPVFFIQERAGKDGKVFRAYKLRTMVDNAVAIGGKKISQNDARITRVGKYLRWGVDELPQLINVFKGNMSLVGPRPTLPEQVARYSKEHRRRLETVSYTHLRAHETRHDLVCRLLLEKKKKTKTITKI